MVDDVSRAVVRLYSTTKQVLQSPLRVVDEDPLIEQLRSAVHPSGESKQPGTTSGSTVGSAAPLDLEAVRILSELETWVHQVYWIARTMPGAPVRRPGVGGYSMRERLRLAHQVAEKNQDFEFLDEAPSWCHQIQRLFDPVKVVPLRGVACPACGQQLTPVPVDRGEFIDQPALQVIFGDTLKIRCGECGASWLGKALLDLASLVGADAQVMAHWAS